jgi:hypothetical protein
MRKSMFRSKSVWTGLLTAVVSAASAVGVPVPPEAVTGLIGLLGVFLRLGIDKGK